MWFNPFSPLFLSINLCWLCFWVFIVFCFVLFQMTILVLWLLRTHSHCFILLIVEVECDDVIIPFCLNDGFEKREWFELNDDVEWDGMWSMISQGAFLFTVFKWNSICVSGLSSRQGPRSFYYDLSSDKEGMFMNSQCFNPFSF